MKITQLLYNDLFNNYSIDDLQLLSNRYFGIRAILTPELIYNMALIHSDIMKASMNGRKDFLQDYKYNVRKYFSMNKSELLQIAIQKQCTELIKFILDHYNSSLTTDDINKANNFLNIECNLSRVCPQGYKLDELKDIAESCGIDIKNMTKKEICLAIHDKNFPKSNSYNVLTNGVMLADEYISKKTGKPIINPIGWLASEKFDGVRAIWDGENFISRSGKIYNAPKWFKDIMPKIPLDGELSIGRDKFQQTVSIVRTKIPNDTEWKKIVYHVFDMPSSTENAEKRILDYTSIVNKICQQHSYCPIIAVSQKKITSENDLQQQYDKILQNGGEGMMLRKPNSKYTGKRTRDLLKYKPTFDAEAKIIDYEYGTGKYSNLLGAFVVNDIKSGKQFKVGSGLTDIIRNDYKKTHPLGTIITYKYTGLTDSRIPRHPRYYRIRDFK